MKKIVYLALCFSFLCATCLYAATPSDAVLNEALKKGLSAGPLANVPLEITDVAINWDKTAHDASGRFSVRTRTTEGLYQPASTAAGLQKLDIADIHESQLNEALETIDNLPVSYRNTLRNALAEARLDLPRFYDVLVPQGGDVAVRGSVRLVLYGTNDWQVDTIQVNPFAFGNNFTPASRLQAGEYRLDDPQTKEAVNTVIQNRKDFVAKVDAAVAEWQKEQEELNEILKKELTSRDLLSNFPLEIIEWEIIEVVGNWTDKSSGDASGTFWATTRATEGLYQSVSTADGLQSLGIADLHEREFNDAVARMNNLPATHATNLRNTMPTSPLNWQFYDVLVPRGGEITLSGNVTLVKYGFDDWEVDEIHVIFARAGRDGLLFLPSDNCQVHFGNFTPESQLREGYRLDAPQTREAINAAIQSRRDFVARVDTAFDAWTQQQEREAAEAERQRLEEERLAEIRRRAERDAKIRRAVELNIGFARERGFPGTGHDTREYPNTVSFGTAVLREELGQAAERLRTAGPFEDRVPLQAAVTAVQTRIRTERERIANQAFHWNCTWTGSNLAVDIPSDQASFTMRVNVGFVISGTEQGIIGDMSSLPAMGITASEARSNFNREIALHLSGNVASIRELWDNSRSYQVTVWFDNMRYNRDVPSNITSGVWWSNVSANVLKIEVFDTRVRNVAVPVVSGIAPAEPAQVALQENTPSLRDLILRGSDVIIPTEEVQTAVQSAQPAATGSGRPLENRPVLQGLLREGLSRIPL